MKIMANNSEERKFRRRIKLFEEEEIDRRLKEAGLYESSDSFATRKLIVMQALGGLVETSKSIGKNEPLPDPKLTSFEDEFNIVDDEDDIPMNNSSVKQHREKPQWKSLFVDSDEEFDSLLATPTKNLNSVKSPFNPLQQQHSLNLQGVKPKNVLGKAKTEESYGSKMLAASMKKNEDNTNVHASSSCQLVAKKINHLKVPEKRNEKKNNFSEATAAHHSDTRKDGSISSINPNCDTDDDDFLPMPKERVGKSDQPSSSFTQVPKIKTAAMKVKMKKYSEMLKLVDQKIPNSLPDTYDFQSKGSYEKLIEDEERLKRICQESCYKPVKWRRPIILDASNNRKRRPNFNPPFKKNSPPMEVTQAANEIICDSPPASSLRKLNLSPQSPVLEIVASRNRSRVDITEIIDAEMESPLKQKITNHIEKEILQDCPICNKSFSLAEIEDHAAGCFSYEMEEEPIEQQRPERIATRSVRSRNNWNERGPRGNGADLVADVVIETEPSDKEDDDSDFEFNGDNATKRNRKRSLSKGKKRRI